jgi:hypothetical protein
VTLTAITRKPGSAKTPYHFHSELWMRPPTESWHVHGAAMDVGGSWMRTKALQRELIERYAARESVYDGLPMLAAREMLMRGPVAPGPLAVWGGRAGSVQLGSAEDRRRVRTLAIRTMIARTAPRTNRRLTVTQLALRDLGRELDLIWPI